MTLSDDTLTPLTDEQRRHFGWLDASFLKKVVSALEAKEANGARFVGGCVRDSLLGDAPKDFDIATRLAPDDAVAALKKAGLGVALTGVEHGTVTAIVDHRGVEVTTLRADVSTDGRRAVVAFTHDWTVDAERRDFRINAVYLTPDGKIFDPVGGVADAMERRVRFIGDAKRRIREDYLRILRFFRFTARFSEAFDAEGLRACEALKDGLQQLSAERVGAEVMAILSLPRAGFALTAMQETGVLAEVWSKEADVSAVERLKRFEPRASAPLTLAVLYGAEGAGVGTRLRLSNAEKAIRRNALEGGGQIVSGMDAKSIRALNYHLGRDIVDDSLAAARAFQKIDAKEHERFNAVADAWKPPIFPVSGKHVIAEGVPAGPAVNDILNEAEAQWIAEDFPASERVLVILKKTIERRTKA